MFRKITSFLLSLCISAAALSGMAISASAAGTETEMTEFGLLDENGVYHIQTAEHLKNISEASKEEGHYVNSADFVLDNDIELTNNDEDTVNIAPYRYGAIFHGTFDGNGHTISGLTYTTHLIATGLFGQTEGATIKNLVIDRADINATYTGGIVVGIAENTKLMNISIRNSKTQCLPGNPIISLFTDGGLSLGALVGQAGNNSLIYNCESINTSLECSEVKGGDVIGGSGAYIGGLVGSLNNSHVEYSRTISEGNINNGNITCDTVSILGLVTVSYIYTGGVAGEIKKEASIIDSFSNISIHNKYIPGAVGVGSASYGYVGGIVGAVYGKTAEISRCHYSGYAEALDDFALAFHFISNNNHLGGIAGRISDKGGGGSIDEVTNLDERFTSLYYNYDRIIESGGDKENAVAWRNGTPSVYKELRPKTSGSYSDNQYSDKENSWEKNGYDFEGTQLRDTPCSVLFGSEGANHVNRWIMDTYNYSGDTEYKTTTMPIHASSAAIIYSNINNAFEDENPVHMQYNYSVTDDEKVVIPKESELQVINPELQNDGFIGIALVSRINETDICDKLYAPGAEVDADVFEEYASDPDKRIYAVWCQAKTLGAQLGLNSGNEGLRVLTAVNTDLLDNIGLDLPDDEYGRGATFETDNTEYFIEADSREWRGEAYYDKSKIDDVSNARVFSIFAFTDEDDYNKQITYSGDILYNGIDEDGEAGLFDFLCGSYETSISDIAQQYLSDLEASGASEEDNYGLTDEQYGVLKQYID